MAKVKDCPGFETFGADVKEARKAKNLARKDLAEKVTVLLLHPPKPSTQTTAKTNAINFFIQSTSFDKYLRLDMGYHR